VIRYRAVDQVPTANEAGVAMTWLFERMIETAAWVAFILGIVFLCEAVWMLVEWARHMNVEGSKDYLIQSGRAAASFVASALAMGILACIDHYVFDYEDRIAAQNRK
jgi:hypothetical protein